MVDLPKPARARARPALAIPLAALAVLIAAALVMKELLGGASRAAPAPVSADVRWRQGPGSDAPITPAGAEETLGEPGARLEAAEGSGVVAREQPSEPEGPSPRPDLLDELARALDTFAGEQPDLDGLRVAVAQLGRRVRVEPGVLLQQKGGASGALSFPAAEGLGALGGTFRAAEGTVVVELTGLPDGRALPRFLGRELLLTLTPDLSFAGLTVRHAVDPGAPEVRDAPVGSRTLVGWQALTSAQAGTSLIGIEREALAGGEGLLIEEPEGLPMRFTEADRDVSALSDWAALLGDYAR